MPRSIRGNQSSESSSVPVWASHRAIFWNILEPGAEECLLRLRVNKYHALLYNKILSQSFQTANKMGLNKLQKLQYPPIGELTK